MLEMSDSVKLASLRPAGACAEDVEDWDDTAVAAEMCRQGLTCSDVTACGKGCA